MKKQTKNLISNDHIEYKRDIDILFFDKTVSI